MKTYQLFLGRNIPENRAPVINNGKPIWQVTATAFHLWQTEILDHFLDGYTLQDAEGYWHGEKEATKVLTILGTREQADFLAKSYCEWFAQEAVGLIQLPLMEFVSA